MTKVFYFSAPGNSLYAAKRTAQELGGELIPVTRYGGGPVEADRIVIVTPEHAFGLPAVTADFIKKLKTDAPVWMVVTYGGAVMGADRAAYEDAKAAGLDIRAVFTLRMAENFTVFVPVPKGGGKRAIKKAPARLDAVISRIRAGEAAEPRRKKGGRRDSEGMREGWRSMGKRLWVSEDCVGCGKCAGLCPAGNIRMENGRPVFGDKCTACLGCYHRCPKKAIKYGRFNLKFRWFCPLVNENELEV